MPYPLTPYQIACDRQDVIDAPCEDNACNLEAFTDKRYKPCEECGRMLCPNCVTVRTEGDDYYTCIQCIAKLAQEARDSQPEDAANAPARGM